MPKIQNLYHFHILNDLFYFSTQTLSRFMNSPKGRYKGALSCAIETAKNEGFFAFYKGFNASFSRLVSWNICLWLTYEQFKKVIQQQYNQR